ncbi:hypothetical protein GF366_01730 [Candidatus Peregrinibacteria bacterium]|nr:hypothetical protein [Candidatus Peregrinibacteria bacterium]
MQKNLEKKEAEEREYQPTFLERLKYGKSLTKKPREGFKEYIETKTITFRKNFRLGAPEAGKKYEKESKIDISKIEAEEVYIFSSSGSTEFEMVWHEPDWYRSYIDAANQIKNCYELLDPKTQRWVRKVRPALEGLIRLGKLDETEYQKRYRKIIWKMVQKYGAHKIYGRKGVFNLLLTFRRATEVYPALKKTADKNFDPESLNIQKIKLILGKGRGKKEGAEDRYAYVVIKRKRRKGEEIAKAPETPEISERQKRILNTFIEKLEMPWYEKPPKSKKEFQQWLLFWHLNYAKSRGKKGKVTKENPPLKRPESFEALKKEFEDFAEKHKINESDKEQILSFLKAKSIEPMLGDYEYDIITSLNSNIIEDYTKETAAEWWESIENWQRILYKLDWRNYLPWTLAQNFPEQEKIKSFSSMRNQEIKDFLKEDESRAEKIGNFIRK